MFCLQWALCVLYHRTNLPQHVQPQQVFHDHDHGLILRTRQMSQKGVFRIGILGFPLVARKARALPPMLNEWICAQNGK